MNLSKFSLALLAVAFLCSCKKDKSGEGTVYPNYSQLKTGNYWVYQRFEVDSLGNATPTQVYDSCYIEKDTLINNRVYYKMVKPPHPNMPFTDIQYLRDSLHYIVNHHGARVFSSEDYTGVFSDFDYTQGSYFLYNVYSHMAEKDFTVTTPAGPFVTSSLKITYTIWPDIPEMKRKKLVYRRYAKDVGIVVETLSPSLYGDEIIERRLLRYKVD